MAFFFLQGRIREREKQSENVKEMKLPHILVHCLSAWKGRAEADQIRSQKLHLGHHHRCQEPKCLGPLSVVFQARCQEVGSVLVEAGLDPGHSVIEYMCSRAQLNSLCNSTCSSDSKCIDPHIHWKLPCGRNMLLYLFQYCGE